MTAYNIVNPGSLVAGQPEDVSQVLANLTAIQAILNGNIDGTNLKNYPGDATKVLLGNMTWASNPNGMPKITTSTLAGGPPALPADGDIWIATAVDASDTRWAFQYNAGSASAFKWDFIGGSETYATVDAFETTNSIVYADMTTVGPSITLARAGDYMMNYGAHYFESIAVAGMQGFVAPSIGGAVPAVGDEMTPFHGNNIGTLQFPMHRSRVKTGIVAGNVVKLQYKVGSATVEQFGYRYLAIRPMRIS